MMNFKVNKSKGWREQNVQVYEHFYTCIFCFKFQNLKCWRLYFSKFGYFKKKKENSDSLI
jgi:hypothetical protein